MQTGFFDGDQRPRAGFWLSSPNVAAAEICHAMGYDFVVLDVEHGVFDLAVLERFIPTLLGLDLVVLAKVLGPNRQAIQQALDFGADGVVIPHVLGARDVERVAAHAKYPPLGDRGFGGGRTARYSGVSDEWINDENRRTSCFPLIERSESFGAVHEILANDCVDGIFIGPSDLSLSRGRGAYKRTEGDYADIELASRAAVEAGKPWLMCPWDAEELDFCRGRKPGGLALVMEHSALRMGFAVGIDRYRGAFGV
jgi:4-hydroxy-2-oxoheptanedioate aldolase